MTSFLQVGSPAVTIAALIAAIVCAAVAWHTVRTARRQVDDRIAALAAAIHGGEATAGAEAIREDGGRLASFRTPALIGMGAAIVAAVFAGAVIWTAGAAATPARDERPLELAQLQHGVTADAFTVSGEVAVPAGHPVHGLAVELVTLDQQGHAIASGGAAVALDAAPAGRVPFSVSVPYSGGVSRYTIRFRDGSGLRPHVDRRRIQVTRP